MADPRDSPISKPQGAEDQRNAARESIFLGARVAHAGKTIHGRIRNISAKGANLEADAALFSGDRIKMTFRGFEDVDATVTRATALGVGVRFDEPIYPAICRRGEALVNQPPLPSRFDMSRLL